MSRTFNLSIIAVDKIIYQGKVTSLVAPCALGYLGVLTDHAPLIAEVVAGKIILKEESGASIIFKSQSPGFLEVLHNNADIILTREGSLERSNLSA